VIEERCYSARKKRGHQDSKIKFVSSHDVWGKSRCEKQKPKGEKFADGKKENRDEEGPDPKKKLLYAKETRERNRGMLKKKKTNAEEKRKKTGDQRCSRVERDGRTACENYGGKGMHELRLKMKKHGKEKKSKSRSAK